MSTTTKIRYDPQNYTFLFNERSFSVDGKIVFVICDVIANFKMSCCRKDWTAEVINGSGVMLSQRLAAEVINGFDFSPMAYGL